VEAVKWLAFVLMVGDHVNAYFMGYGFAPAYLGGRLVLPLFALVLGYGFAQASHGAQGGILRRLLIWGAVAQVPWLAFEHDYLVNIMGTLWAGCAWWYAVSQPHRWPARAGLIIAAVLLGLVSEYTLPGVLLVVAACFFAQRPGPMSVSALVASLVLLWPVNGTWFAVLALPVWYFAGYLPEVPRARGLFYKAYAGQWATCR